MPEVLIAGDIPEIKSFDAVGQKIDCNSIQSFSHVNIHKCLQQSQQKFAFGHASVGYLLVN
jgi:hypothetical protein